MSVLNKSQYEKFLLSEYSNLPTGRYVHLVIIRKTLSETIFRTEGGGEPLVREYVNISGEPTFHIVMSKRKQTAVERRTGRELLRKYGLLKDKDGNEDILNDSKRTFEGSVDAWIYGYAVGSGGAQKSRVITEDAFSLLPAHMITDNRTFNAAYDNGTMRHPESGEASTSLGSSEYVKPETHFLDIETIKDVTADELFYVIGNVLRSKRYGAISSRIGRMDNTIAAIVFADTEIFSTLELTKNVYKVLGEHTADHPIKDGMVLKAVQHVVPILQQRVVGEIENMNSEDLKALLDETSEIYKDSEKLVKRLAGSYPNSE